MRKLRPTASLQVLLAAAALFAGLAHAQGMELQTQVEALVESGPSEVLGARIAHPKLIHAFYSQRAFRPAWTAKTAAELLRAVVDSEADGLDPNDYHVAVLRQSGEPPRPRRLPHRLDRARCQPAMIGVPAGPSLATGDR